jgi:putative ABC transport system substrate-binding protein
MSLKRRDFIKLLGGAAAWPLAADAQQAGKAPTIGLLGANDAAAQSLWTVAFVQRLRELGWIEGRNIAIEYRWAEARSPSLTGKRLVRVPARAVQARCPCRDNRVTGSICCKF